MQEQLSKVSFGALSKAQDSLSKQNDSSRKRKRGTDHSADQEDKLQALRERLRELKKVKGKESSTKKSANKAKVQESDAEDASDGDSESGSDQKDAGKKSKSRSSKHAPAVMSSKKPVSRKREILASQKRIARDPRFDSLSGALDTNQVRDNYAFLDEYRDSEMAELKATIKKTKSDEDKEILKRKLLSMESQKKAKASKERREKVMKEHKKQEKEAVKEGKTPFFLKKCKFAGLQSVFLQSSMLIKVCYSRGQETGNCRSVCQHEEQGEREAHREEAQEGHWQGKEEYARRQKNG